MAEKRRTPEIITGRVNSDGTIATGDGFSVVKTGTGLYVVTLAGGFRLVSAVTSGVVGTIVANPTQLTERTINVSTQNQAGTLQDQAFTFIAVGVQQ